MGASPVGPRLRCHLNSSVVHAHHENWAIEFSDRERNQNMTYMSCDVHRCRAGKS